MHSQIRKETHEESSQRRNSRRRRDHVPPDFVDAQHVGFVEIASRISFGEFADTSATAVRDDAGQEVSTRLSVIAYGRPESAYLPGIHGDDVCHREERSQTGAELRKEKRALPSLGMAGAIKPEPCSHLAPRNLLVDVVNPACHFAHCTGGVDGDPRESFCVRSWIF